MLLNLKTVIIIGPTASGKTALAERFAEQAHGELINLDMGQMYAPLTIGTAKPDWQLTPFAQHLFDIITEPIHFDAARYRARVETLLPEITARHHLPILVGGSGFYCASLFFKLPADTRIAERKMSDASWERLRQLDPTRAAEIHPNDTYRIARALEQYAASGILPSQHKPSFDPVTQRAQLVVVTRDRQELIERIDQRVDIMIQQGWLNEVAALPPAWQQFCLEKKIIGYNELIAYQQGVCTLPAAVEHIKIRTRQYAKRQVSYAKMLVRQLQQYPLPRPIELNLSKYTVAQATDVIADLMQHLP